MKFIHKNRHFLMMATGCAAMLVAVFVLTTTTSGGSWGVYLLLLICPAMHILMHRGMHGDEKGHQMAHTQLQESGKEMMAKEQARPPK